MIALRVFVCNSTEENIGGEVTNSGFTKCWGTEQLIFSAFSIISLAFFLGLLLISLIGMSLNYFQSPLPWADDHIFIRILILTQKLGMVILLLYDYEVTYILN